mmetsp:Transcript_11890/g.42534  ORF Transcript_11890/g.42534 Transcript_11890/m.42534 type:complete len:218 (+) Transcript_11890:93-746(+)
MRARKRISQWLLGSPDGSSAGDARRHLLPRGRSKRLRNALSSTNEESRKSLLDLGEPPACNEPWSETALRRQSTENLSAMGGVQPGSLLSNSLALKWLHSWSAVGDGIELLHCSAIHPCLPVLLPHSWCRAWDSRAHAHGQRRAQRHGPATGHHGDHPRGQPRGGGRGGHRGHRIGEGGHGGTPQPGRRHRHDIGHQGCGGGCGYSEWHGLWLHHPG